MYKELSLLDIEKNHKDVQESIVFALNHNISGLVLFPHYIGQMRDYIPHGITLACPIDYPYGVSDTPCRNHMVLSAIRKGANTIDLMVQTSLVVNRKYKKIVDDVSINHQVCKDNGVTLRVVLDYRLVPTHVTEKIAMKLKDIGVEYILPSNGFFLEDFDDALLISRNIQQKTKIPVIFTSAFNKTTQIESLEAAQIFGIRLKNISALQTFKFCSKNGV
jgi:deoxyribose-phosphate aldolase